MGLESGPCCILLGLHLRNHAGKPMIPNTVHVVYSLMGARIAVWSKTWPEDFKMILGYEGQ